MTHCYILPPLLLKESYSSFHSIGGAHLFVICGIGCVLELPTQLFLILFSFFFEYVISPTSYVIFVSIAFHHVDC